MACEQQAHWTADYRANRPLHRLRAPLLGSCPPPPSCVNEDRALGIEVPALCSPGLFLPIPDVSSLEYIFDWGVAVTDYFLDAPWLHIMRGLSLQSDPLTVLLAKYIPDPDRRPRRDVSGDYSQSDFQTLMVGSFLDVPKGG
jgi:hypothetical protein